MLKKLLEKAIWSVHKKSAKMPEIELSDEWQTIVDKDGNEYNAIIGTDEKSKTIIIDIVPMDK